MKKLLPFLLIASLITTSCQRDDLHELKETIYVKNNGATMPAYVYGKGSSKTFMIVIHGGPGGTGLQYRQGEYYKALEQEMAMVYWDQRGQGMSQGNYPLSELNIEQMTDDLQKLILALREHYGRTIDVYLLGHSWGGMLGSAFLIQRNLQKQVKGWIEVAGAHDMPRLAIESVKLFQEVSTQQIAVNHNAGWWTETKAYVDRIDTNNISFEQSLEMNQKAYEAEQYLMEDNVIDIPDFYLPNLYSPTNLLTSAITGRITNAYLSAEVEKSALTDELQKITIPSLFIWGLYDLVVPLQLGVDAFNEVSSTDKKLVIFERSGHSPMINEPEKFSIEVLDFVERTK